MSTEELETAYLDAMQRLKGSVCGPQLAVPIEEYVNEVKGKLAQILMQWLGRELEITEQLEELRTMLNIHSKKQP